MKDSVLFVSRVELCCMYRLTLFKPLSSCLVKLMIHILQYFISSVIIYHLSSIFLIQYIGIRIKILEWKPSCVCDTLCICVCFHLEGFGDL